MWVQENQSIRRAKRREEILAAGEICLFASGYEGLKMQDVAAHASVAKGTVYLYFPSRDALCACVAERNLSSLLSEFRAIADEAPNGLAAMEGVLEKWLSHLDKRPHVGRVMAEWWRTKDIDAGSDAFNAYQHRAQGMLRFFETLLERGQSDGSVHAEVQPRYDALALWGAIFGAQLFSSNPAGTRLRLGAFDPALLRGAQLRSLLRSLSARP
ncbi:MAG: TetR/AcrR family transcriptional regulator [Polyangiales bacterium]